MGSLVKSIFGGKDSSAQKAQIDANRQDRALFERLAQGASRDAKSLFGAADENRNMGFQQAVNLLGGVIPQQLRVQQQGNYGAQQQLINSLPMIQAAIMGQPVNFGGMQPTTIGFNTNFTNQTLPQFKTTGAALTPQQSTQQQPDLSYWLRGGGGRFNV